MHPSFLCSKSPQNNNNAFFFLHLLLLLLLLLLPASSSTDEFGSDHHLLIIYPKQLPAMFQFKNYYYHLLLSIIFFIVVFITETANSQLCGQPSGGCGNFVNLAYPFWQLQQDNHTPPEQHCGYPGFGIYCSDGRPTLTISKDLYYVEEYQESSLRIVNRDFVGKTCPRPRRNFSLPDYLTIDPPDQPLFYLNRNMALFFNCSVPPLNDPDMYNITCLDYNATVRSYAQLFRDDSGMQWWASQNCEESVVVPMISTDFNSLLNLTNNYSMILQRGIRLNWKTPSACERCEPSGGNCLYNETSKNFNCTCSYDAQIIHGGRNSGGKEYCLIPSNYGGGFSKVMISVFAGVGGLIVLVLLFIYIKHQRKRTEGSTPNVELFLENYGCLSLQRFKYKDIKKMTNSFKDKLGQGGYGSVFKGKLVDGRPVAVKILVNNPKKSTGEDFINEVAAIGTTNHVNVVTLFGFCSSGSKRALVYEFMPNGSLEKFIYIEKKKSDTNTTAVTTIEKENTNTTADTTTIDLKHSLGWEKLYQIALGIARGLEYLHRGCNTRILHFDIKPHNILLDENFCPKISDFGLAKLCPTRETIVSTLGGGGGRGTAGYIAPEVYDRNFGRVSYKSDVYSYGKMVLEMVGGRKNIDPLVENTSEIYFPHWIYDRLQEEKGKIEGLLRFEQLFEEEMARKMIIVSLWCIQTNPANRPSMDKVAEMLEGSIENLQMPPKPFMGSPPPPPPPTS